MTDARTPGQEVEEAQRHVNTMLIMSLYEEKFQYLASVLAARDERIASLERAGAEAKEADAGKDLYMDLARSVIARLLEVDVKCTPQGDLRLRLEALIHERDSAHRARAEKEQELSEWQQDYHTMEQSLKGQLAEAHVALRHDGLTALEWSLRFGEKAAALAEAHAALTLVLQTWAEAWDCSRDPGHVRMQEACIEAEKALTPTPPPPPASRRDG